MTASDDYDDSLQALHRMIAYIRDEAARLRIPDVALLLAQAEEAVLSAGSRGDAETDAFWMGDRSPSRVEH